MAFLFGGAEPFFSILVRGIMSVLVVWWSRTICAIFVEGIIGNIPVNQWFDQEIWFEEKVYRQRTRDARQRLTQ